MKYKPFWLMALEEKFKQDELGGKNIIPKNYKDIFKQWVLKQVKKI